MIQMFVFIFRMYWPWTPLHPDPPVPPSLSPGGVPADLSRHLRRAAEDLHGARGGRVCPGDAGQPPHHGSVRVPPGGGEAAVHRQDRGEPAVHQPG